MVQKHQKDITDFLMKYVKNGVFSIKFSEANERSISNFSSISDLKELPSEIKAITSSAIKNLHDSDFAENRFKKIQHFPSVIIDHEDADGLFNNTDIVKVPQIVDTDKIKFASRMFARCKNLKEVPDLEFKNAIDASNMFFKCISLQNVGKLIMPKADGVRRMFRKTPNLQHIEDLVIANNFSADPFEEQAMDENGTPLDDLDRDENDINKHHDKKDKHTIELIDKIQSSLKQNKLAEADKFRFFNCMKQINLFNELEKDSDGFIEIRKYDDFNSLLARLMQLEICKKANDYAYTRQHHDIEFPEQPKGISFANYKDSTARQPYEYEFPKTDETVYKIYDNDDKTRQYFTILSPFPPIKIRKSQQQFVGEFKVQLTKEYASTKDVDAIKWIVADANESEQINEGLVQNKMLFREYLQRRQYKKHGR